MIKPITTSFSTSSPQGDDDDGGFSTSEDWFAEGRRVQYDPSHKRIVESNRSKVDTIGVFERTVLHAHPHAQTRWATFLPGFPDGSYGYAKVDRLLQTDTTPRLYVEYVGQGDSDKPKKYTYSTVERADLVEAQWRSHNVSRTVVVAFDYSSLVLLELLQRQKERISQGTRTPRIEHVLAINGGLFADGHSHPYSTTPLLKTRSSMAQRSNFVFNQLFQPLYSKEYKRTKLTRQELRENAKAIRRHKGASFMSNAAGFVDEHKQNPQRWDLYNVYVDFAQHQGITFHLVGSDKDRFEHNQITLARERLHDYYPDIKIDTIPGGHLSLAEQADKIAEFVNTLVRKGANATQQRSWTNTDLPAVATVSTTIPSWSTVRQ